MANDSFWPWFLSYGPFWGGFLAILIWMVRTWPAWKQRLTEARTADDVIVGNQWKRFQEEIKRLDQRCEGLEDKVRECEAREAAWIARVNNAEGRASTAEAMVARLEAINQGRGEVRQEVTLLDSNEKLGRREVKKDKK